MKKISLITSLLFTLIMGTLFASVIDQSVITVSAVLISLGSLPFAVQGALFVAFSNLDWADGTENMGGLQVIGYYAPIADIDNFPLLPANPTTPTEEVTLESATGFTMKTDKVFLKIYSTLETSEVVDENQGEADGQSFVHKANIFYPGTSVEALSFAKGVNNSNMAFIFTQANGQRRVIGSRAFPARCKTNFTSGKATADRKGMTMEIYSYGYTPAPLYTGVILLADGAIS